MLPSDELSEMALFSPKVRKYPHRSQHSGLTSLDHPIDTKHLVVGRIIVL